MTDKDFWRGALFALGAIVLAVLFAVVVVRVGRDDPVPPALLENLNDEAKFQEFAVEYMGGTLHCIERVADTTRIGFSCDFVRFHKDNE